MSVEMDKLKEKIMARPEQMPGHIAIIMDGNGRWAAQRNEPRTEGHKAGVEAVKEVVKAAADLEIKFLTLYTFSVENWKRPREEVAALMELLFKTTLSEMKELLDSDIKLITTGRVNGLPAGQRHILEKAIALTRNNKGLTLNLALNYGGRTEILDAVKAIANSIKGGLFDLKDIDEQLFSEFLYTADIPDPDLMIRTSGEWRISNFLLWQTSYTELYIIDTLWPDFGRKELFEAVLDYQGRERRFGRIAEQDSV